jgi:predicted ATPase/DNA-binding SARP family transcriptional activator
MELAEILRQLRSARLVTLSGPGGSGKTRLAIEVAHVAAETGQVAWVDLAPLSDPALLARHVSATVGLAERPDRSDLELLVASLRPLELLLVLDNCEHLVAGCAELAHALLSECPDLRILATSRESLGIGGETSWVVPPLSLPASADPTTAEGIAHSEAVELFVSRARAVQPSFVLTDGNAPAVADVCRQLEGIPLAIELAAARMNVLSVEQVASRLDDVFGLLTSRSRSVVPRHRTLRNAIDWSYALLDELEQLLFRRLAVFLGGFTLEAVEGVCAGDGITAESVLDLVSALVDKSLVRAEALHGEARFSLLEPVRQYAQGVLSEAGETEAMRARHAAHFVALAERAEPWIRGGTRGSEWMVRLERDHGNLRAAVEWCGEDAGRVQLQLRLDAALGWFYFAQGYFSEPRRRLSQALAWAGFLDRLVLGRAYTALGYCAIWQADYAHVMAPIQTGVALLRQESDAAALSFALTGLGAAVGLAGDAPAAYALFDEAQSALGGRDGSHAGGFPTVLLFTFASYWRGVVAQFHGDLERARASFELCVSVARQLDDHPTIAHPLAALARVLTLQGDYAGARRCLAESLPIHAGNDDRWGLAEALEAAAHLAAEQRDARRAAALLGAADTLRQSMGLALPPHQLADRGRLTAAIQAQVGEHGMAEALTAGQALGLEQMMAVALGTSAPVPGRPQPGRSAGAARDDEAAAASHQPAAGPASLDAELDSAELGVLALGPLKILRRGAALESGAWGSAKPRELLLYLLCHPDGVTRDQIGLALWPDAATDKVSNSFHVTLHRLRKALGDPAWVTKAADRYGVAPHVRTVFDATVFEAETAAGMRDLKAGRDALERLRAALAIYRGPFLDDEVVGDWHLPVRDRLQRLHLDGLLALGGRLFDSERWTEAAETYWRLIANDDLHEEGYRRLMLSLAHAGDRSQALRLYPRLCTLLDEELGARPEPETVALFERLQDAGPL